MGQAMRFLTATSLCGLFTLAATSSFAAPPAQAGAPAPAPAPAAAPAPATPSANTQTVNAKAGEGSGDAVERARVHYERGLTLFNEGNYDAALFEFERAYELAPSYKILYNMGRIQREQNNYAAALRSYARYLREGGTAIPAERRTEVEKEIALLKPRTAEITVKVNVDGANVYSDDVPVCVATIESSCVGISPLQEPIVVNSGRHKITATKKGWSTATAMVSVVGSDRTEVRLELVDLTPKEQARPNPWIVPMVAGWSATGLTLVGAGITGGLAMGARNDLEEERNKPPTTQTPQQQRQALDDARDKVQTLSGVSDALWITGGIFGGVSAYFTIKALTHKKFGNKEEAPPPAEPAKTARRAEPARKVDFRFGPTGIGAVGTF